VPSTLHQRITIWRGDGLVENIEADQSYFLAEVNNINKSNFDKHLANISPCTSLGPKYEVQDNKMFSMRLYPNIGFVWEREVADQGYVVVDHGEVPLTEDNVLRTRASTYRKRIDSPTPTCPAYAIPPTGWDVDE